MVMISDAVMEARIQQGSQFVALVLFEVALATFLGWLFVRARGSNLKAFTLGVFVAAVTEDLLYVAQGVMLLFGNDAAATAVRSVNNMGNTFFVGFLAVCAYAFWDVYRTVKVGLAQGKHTS